MSTDSDRLVELLTTELDPPLHRYAALENYFHGSSPLSYLSKDAKTALAKFDQVSSNVCETAIVSVGERLRLAGFDGHPDAWPLFLGSNLDQLSGTGHERACLYSTCPVLIWTDQHGRPRATVEHPKFMATQRDPITRDIVAAVKRVRTKTETHCWVYLESEVQHWVANTPGAVTAGFTLRDRVPNPVGVVPVAELGLEGDKSVIENLISLQDMLNKQLLDLMVASEFSGRPRRWATGIERIPEAPLLDSEGNVVTEDGEPVIVPTNPYPEQNRLMIAEWATAKIGQLDPTDLGAFEAGVRIIMSQVMMASGLPAHYVGVLQDSVTSADALRAAESALVARVEAKQRAYGTAWERVAALLVGMSTGTDPDSINVRVKWSPADTRSQAQEADAAVKLFQSGLLDRATTLQKLGYSAEEIAVIEAALSNDTAAPSNGA